MRMVFRLLVIGTVIVLLGGALSPGVEASPPLQEPPAAGSGAAVGALSTPKLIERALANGDIDQETALLYMAYALGDYEKLPVQFNSNIPWDGTLPLSDLQEAAKTMKAGPKRDDVIGVLIGVCSSENAALPNVLNSTHFHIQYNTVGGGLTVNDYSTSLEATWTQEITNYGWAAPPVLAANPPPGGLYHVRIDPLGGGLYGFVSSSGAHAGFVGDNPNTVWNDVDALASCMSLNDDFTGFPGSPQQALDATTAHEFNHSIQYAYGGAIGANTPDDVFFEGGATWMEDEVFDAANDNYNYLWPNFSQCMGEYTASPYPYWITFRGLTERFGSNTPGGGEKVMQDFWELTSQNAASNLAALNTALVNKGTTLADAFHAYAIAVKFNKPCGGGYTYPHCFEEGANYVAEAGQTPVNGSIAAIGNSFNGSVQDNYAINWVTLPTTSPYAVTLQNSSAGGQLRASVVCDTGTALNVTPLPAVVATGASSQLTSFNPAGCNSVVAVITNQSQTADNPTSCTARSYSLQTSANSPAAPSALTATPFSSSQINLAWVDNSANEDGFKVERSPNGTTGWTQINTVAANVTTYADTPVSCGTPYFYRVIAYNIFGNSSPTTVANATTLCAPTVLTATAVSTSTIDLTWQDNSTGETGFKIERSPDGTTGWTEIDQVGANVTNYTNANLGCNTSYHYRVRAYNASSNSDYSNSANAKTLACPALTPTSPTVLNATAVSTSAITLNWQDNSKNETGFKVERSNDGVAGWAEIAQVAADTNTYTDINRACGTRYYYQVIAYNGFGSSDYTNVAAAETGACDGDDQTVFLPIILKEP